jgi:hypothetical protein
VWARRALNSQKLPARQVQIFKSLLAARGGRPVASVPAFADTLVSLVRKPRLSLEVATADRLLCQVHLPPKPCLPFRHLALTAATGARKTPQPLQMYPHRNSRANLHLLGQPNTFHARKGYAKDGASTRLAHPEILERLDFDSGKMPSSGVPKRISFTALEGGHSPRASVSLRANLSLNVLGNSCNCMHMRARLD